MVRGEECVIAPGCLRGILRSEFQVDVCPGDAADGGTSRAADGGTQPRSTAQRMCVVQETLESVNPLQQQVNNPPVSEMVLSSESQLDSAEDAIAECEQLEAELATARYHLMHI